MKARDVKKFLNITQPTLSKYAKEGLVRYTKINDRHYQYNEDDVYKLVGLGKTKKKKINVSYSRISCSNQTNQLKDQTNRIYEYCISKGIDLDRQLEDVKSGMNFDRKNFQNLIDMIIRGEVELVIVENKDRLVRFGFDLLESIFKYFGTKIFVINDKITNKSYEQELTEDLVSIIHYFSMKMYSNRRKLNKFKKELLNDNNKTSNSK